MKLTLKQVFTIFLILSAFVTAFLYGQKLLVNEEIITTVSNFGYFGVAAIAVIVGLNTIVPLPAATFVPFFIAAGMKAPFIILALTAGTLLADVIGFALGRFGRGLIETKHPKIFKFASTLATEHKQWIIPVVSAYVAFAPAPNELVLIPLALAGVKLRTLLIPLIVGGLIHQTIFTYGAIKATSLLAG